MSFNKTTNGSTPVKCYKFTYTEAIQWKQTLDKFIIKKKKKLLNKQNNAHESLKEMLS